MGCFFCYNILNPRRLWMSIRRFLLYILYFNIRLLKKSWRDQIQQECDRQEWSDIETMLSIPANEWRLYEYSYVGSCYGPSYIAQTQSGAQILLKRIFYHPVSVKYKYGEFSCWRYFLVIEGRAQDASDSPTSLIWWKFIQLSLARHIRRRLKALSRKGCSHYKATC